MTTQSTTDFVGPRRGAASPAQAARAATAVTPRTTVCILFDVSWSVAAAEGSSPQSVREKLEKGLADIQRTPAMIGSLDLAIVTMGVGVHVLELPGAYEGSAFAPFRVPMVIPPFEVDGVTRLGEALTTCLDVIEKELGRLHEAAQTHNVARLVIVTDGSPTDADGDEEDSDWREPLPRLHDLVAQRQLVCSAIGYRAARTDVLEAIAGTGSVHAGDTSLGDVISIVTGTIEHGPDDLDRFRDGS